VNRIRLVVRQRDLLRGLAALLAAGIAWRHKFSAGPA
jgi:hypothetical protein